MRSILTIFTQINQNIPNMFLWCNPCWHENHKKLETHCIQTLSPDLWLFELLEWPLNEIARLQQTHSKTTGNQWLIMSYKSMTSQLGHSPWHSLSFDSHTQTLSSRQCRTVFWFYMTYRLVHPEYWLFFYKIYKFWIKIIPKIFYLDLKIKALVWTPYLARSFAFTSPELQWFF